VLLVFGGDLAEAVEDALDLVDDRPADRRVVGGEPDRAAPETRCQFMFLSSRARLPPGEDRAEMN